jgi:sugar porter (SP) family MFS transporter
MRDILDPAQKRFLYLLAVSFVAAVGGLLFGFDTGVISGAVPFVKQQFGLNSHQEGFAVSNLMIACIVGASVAGPLTDRYGRKKILILAALLFAVSAVLSALPRTFTELVIARFVGGVAVGIASMLSPMYIAEISPAVMRGRLVALNQLAIVIGILTSYLSNWLLVNTGSHNWRWMFAAEAVPAAVFMASLLLIPESPRWLVKQERDDEAFSILLKVGDRAHAREEFRIIQETIHEEHGRFRDLLRPELKKPLIVGILLAFLAHLTGIDVVIYYGPTIFIESGFKSASSALMASVIIGVVNLLATFIGIAMVDRVGRKPLLLVGMMGMGIAMAGVGLSFQSAALGPAWTLFFILFYIASFALSMGVVIFVYLSEIYPTKLRGRAMSIAIMVLWFSNVLITQLFPITMETLGGATFYLLAGICGMTIVFIKTMIKETKGRSLEEIESMWG